MPDTVIRWGILGPGGIARKFAQGLRQLPDAKIMAVGSRSRASADRFGDEFDVLKRHAGYQALADDPDVDVVYVATPHNFHLEHSLLCLRSGKPVLCEKPFTINAAEAETLIAEARARRLFLMEAMWTRFLPSIVKVRELLAAGAIGDVRLLTADFGFRATMNPTSRLFDPALGGGALLDIGVYPVSFAAMVLGTPTRIATLGELGETGVDEQGAVVLGHANGALAVLTSTIQARTNHEGVLFGTRGQIRIHTPFWRSSGLTLAVEGQPEEVIQTPMIDNGLAHQAIAVMDCLRAGRLESDVMPLDESLAVMQTLDRIRAAWGLRYPME